MKTKLVHRSADGLRTFVVVMETGDEAMAGLKRFAHEEAIEGAGLTAIGAFSGAAILYFDWQTKKYHTIPVEEQVEVAAAIGDIGRGEKGEPALHLHVVLGRRDGSALAGHLDKGHVRPTLEIIVTETPAHLRRVHDPESGLALIDLTR
ncbi:MAG TPA: PPC domain-containing DNA-binding protein [Hyphomicrobiales bacterium]|nr:PPC domain-containing DNA-binding protein [Hyphomicrobiales bacterium]